MSDILNLQIPSPTFGGSTGGWLRAAETEEKYYIIRLLNLINYLKVGLIYGLIVDAFKLGS